MELLGHLFLFFGLTTLACPDEWKEQWEEVGTKVKEQFAVPWYFNWKY